MQCSRKIFDKQFIVYAKLRYFFECLHTTHSLLLNHQLPYQFTDDIISSLMVGMGNMEHLTVPEQNRIRSTEFFEEVQNSAQIFVKSKKKKERSSHPKKFKSPLKSLQMVSSQPGPQRCQSC